MAALLFMCAVFTGCGPTYQRENVKETIKKLAEKEYGLDVEVREQGETLSLRFRTPNLIGELTSGNEDIYRKMNGLFMVLIRVVLSTDNPPDFIILDLIDADNPRFRLVFTRYVEDLRKAMAEAISHTQTQDRLLEEFVIGDRHIAFDPQDMDLVRLMLMAMDSSAESAAPAKPSDALEDVDFKYFLERVAENVTRRVLKEEDEISDNTVIRQINARFEPEEAGQLRILLDMASRPSITLAPSFIEETVLPLAAKEVKQLLKSYRFKDFSGITVIEKNTGKILSVSAG
jgi:hypothetical protein